MNRRNEEREINLVDMFWAICLKWRGMLLWGVIFALVLGGIGYYNNAKKTDVEVLESKLKEEDHIYIDMYLTYLDLYDIQKDYNELSPLMQLDPNDFYVNVLTYYVDNHYVVEYPVITERDNIAAIIQSYKTLLRTEEFASSIVEVMEMDDDSLLYCLELVDLYNVYGKMSIPTESYNMFTISVYGSTEENCRKMSELVKSTIDTFGVDMIEQFGEHDIMLIDDITKNVSDINLSSYQKLNIDYLSSYNTALKKSGENLSGAALSYVDVVRADEEEETSVIDIKMIIIGFILGVFVVLFVVAMGYILNKKLRYEDNYERTFGIKLLGMISGSSSNKKKIFAFVDRWIWKKRHANMHKFTSGEEEDMVVSNIKLLAKNQEASKVYLTGATISQVGEDIVDTFAKRLGKDGVELVVGKSIIYNADALEDASEVGCIVMIDKVGEVLYNEIYSMLDCCEAHNIKVLGGVVVR